MGKTEQSHGAVAAAGAPHCLVYRVALRLVWLVPVGTLPDMARVEAVETVMALAAQVLRAI